MRATLAEVGPMELLGTMAEGAQEHLEGREGAVEPEAAMQKREGAGGGARDPGEGEEGVQGEGGPSCGRQPVDTSLARGFMRPER